MNRKEFNKQQRAALAAKINYALLTAHFLMVLDGGWSDGYGEPMISSGVASASTFWGTVGSSG